MPAEGSPSFNQKGKKKKRDNFPIKKAKDKK